MLERGYEIRKCSDTGYCKGGMFGQIVYIDPTRKLSVAWLSFDATGCSSQMQNFLKDLK